MSKITLLISAFTFSDSSRVTFTPTDKVEYRRRVWNFTVSIPTDKGYASRVGQTNDLPSAKRALFLVNRFIKDTKNSGAII